MPFLKECTTLHVRTVVEKGEQPTSLEGLARYLKHHGVEAVGGEVEIKDGGAGETLLDAADNLGADFIVMGAFSKSPWREQLFGGATHAVLRNSKKPLILSN